MAEIQAKKITLLAMIRNRITRPFRGTTEYGGVALEYVLVSTVAFFMTMTILGFSMDYFSEKLKDFGKTHNLDFSGLSLNPVERP